MQARARGAQGRGAAKVREAELELEALAAEFADEEDARKAQRKAATTVQASMRGQQARRATPRAAARPVAGPPGHPAASEDGLGGEAAGDGPASAEGEEAPCGRDQFVAAIRRQDPLAPMGLQLDEQLLDLAWRLLRWRPEERLSAEAALRHPALAEAAATGRELVPHE